MPLLLHVEVHGLAGRAGELREALAEHARRIAELDGTQGAAAYEPLGAEAGEFVLDSWWTDEAALRAHYATSEYSRYAGLVGELLARPSDATVYEIASSYRPAPDLSADPGRQG
jgi:quinol monooxygenase YgiN